MDDKKIVSIGFDDVTGLYNITAGEGVSVAEIAFAIAALAKCLVRDNILESTETFLKLIEKYVTDPQFDEVQEDDDNA